MTQAVTTRSSVFDGPDDDHFPSFHPRLIPAARHHRPTWRVELADEFDAVHVWTGQASSRAEAIHLAACSLSVYCPFFRADNAHVVSCVEVL